MHTYVKKLTYIILLLGENKGMSQDTAESPIFDGDPARPPIHRLEEIRGGRGACAEPRPIEDMQAIMDETAMTVVLGQPVDSENPENDDRGTTNILSFLKRVRTCLDILAEEDKLPGRTFSFADVVFLAGRSIERTLARALKEGKIEEMEHADLMEELLFVAPEICTAFNSASAMSNLPRQRRRWQAIGSVLPIQGRGTD